MEDKKYVITMSRQFGSMGRTIARRLSERLGIEFLDRDIVEETSKRMGLPVSVISDNEESAKSPFFKTLYPLGMAPLSIEDEIFEVQRNIVMDYAAKQSCIIVGRCAESLLRDHPNRLSVHIFAPYENRLDNCTKLLQMDEKTASKMIKEVDIARENYRRRYCKEIDSVFSDHDLILNSATFGIDGCVDIIEAIAKEKLMK